MLQLLFFTFDLMLAENYWGENL